MNRIKIEVLYMTYSVRDKVYHRKFYKLPLMIYTLKTTLEVGNLKPSSPWFFTFS